mmetsp:Transcript_24136/g.51468  ORF Transcript_24136/g.51468 Transcript_24136/m.51468 type:complete len:387 (+) Transcript_24136:232-1392(+)
MMPGRHYTSSSSGSTSAVRRIQRELKEISESPSRHWTAAPVGDDLFIWQFAIRGPPATDFEGGIYTGRLVLPVNYPLGPPSITLLTPNGRFEVGKKICLSNTSYHPEQWQPAWGIRTMMEALRSHFPAPGDGAIAALDWPTEIRRKLAKESLDFVTGTDGRPNRELLPELTPEEMMEDQPEPVPPELQAVREAAAPEKKKEETAPAPGPAVATAPQAAPAQAQAQAQAQQAAQAAAPLPPPPPPLPQSEPIIRGPPAGLQAHPATNGGAADALEGLRQRRAAASSDGAVVATTSSSALSATVSSNSLGRTSRRSRADRGGEQAERRPQASVIVQLVKPPTSRKGWIMLAINAMIFLLTVSFLYTLADIVRNPPKILNDAADVKVHK